MCIGMTKCTLIGHQPLISKSCQNKKMSCPEDRFHCTVEPPLKGHLCIKAKMSFNRRSLLVYCSLKDSLKQRCPLIKGVIKDMFYCIMAQGWVIFTNLVFNRPSYFVISHQWKIVLSLCCIIDETLSTAHAWGICLRSGKWHGTYGI